MSETGRGAVETQVDTPAGGSAGPVVRGQFGRFAVLGELGRGSHGVVLEALDVELRRRVAVKLLQQGGDPDGATYRRLRHEARALAQCNHPNIVAVHDVGVLAGQVYLAMEFVAGISLDRWITCARPKWQDVLAVFKQAGAGLAVAHRAGIVHRDFKPANAILGDDGRVRVLDFGLARLSDVPLEVTSPASGDASEELRTRPGALGTPAYMAPEQYMGGPTDGRTDIFAFCVSLHEALYGARPFAGATMLELSAQVTAGTLEAPPTDIIVPPWLRTVVLRGLRPDPAERWQTMDALLAELGRDLGRRTRRLLTGFAAAALLAAGIGVGLASRADPAEACNGGAAAIAADWDEARRAGVEQALRATGAPYADAAASHTGAVLDAWAAAWATAHRDACEATHVRHEQSVALLDRRMSCLDGRRRSFAALVDVLGDADVLTAERAVVTAAGLPTLDRCADLAWLSGGAEEPSDPERTAALADAGGRAERAWYLIQTAHFEAATAEIAAGEMNAAALADGPLQARWGVLAGNLAERVGDFPRAEATLVEAYFTARAARADEHAINAAINLVHVVGNRLARFDEGTLWRRLALADLPPDASDDPAARLASVWGGALISQGRLREAVAELTRAVALRSDGRGPDAIDVAGPLNSLGVAHFRLGEREAAREHYRRALAIREAHLGPDHPDVARTLSNLASVELELGELDLAEASERRALAIRERCLGLEHSDVAVSLGNLGLIASRRGAHAEAEASLTRALEILRARFGDEHPRVAEVQLNLAATRAEAGRIAEAAQATREVLRISTTTLGPAHPQVGAARANLADLLLRLGDTEGARVEATQALRELEAALGLAHPDLGFALLTLARCDLAQGDVAAAERSVSQALELRTGAGAPDELAQTQGVAAQVLAAAGAPRSRVRALAAQALAGLGEGPMTRDDRAALRTLLQP